MSGGHLAETRKKSDETVAETRCDDRHQITEMEDNLHAKADNA